MLTNSQMSFNRAQPYIEWNDFKRKTMDRYNLNEELDINETNIKFNDRT